MKIKDESENNNRNSQNFYDYTVSKQLSPIKQKY